MQHSPRAGYMLYATWLSLLALPVPGGCDNETIDPEHWEWWEETRGSLTIHESGGTSHRPFLTRFRSSYRFSSPFSPVQTSSFGATLMEVGPGGTVKELGLLELELDRAMGAVGSFRVTAARVTIQASSTQEETYTLDADATNSGTVKVTSIRELGSGEPDGFYFGQRSVQQSVEGSIALTMSADRDHTIEVTGGTFKLQSGWRHNPVPR